VRLALLLGGTLAALLLGEGLVRALWPQPLRPAWDDEVAGVRAPRAGLRGRHRHPGAFDVAVAINGQRFRAPRDFAASPPAGVTRIAALGDSLTFGWGAEDEETWPAQLERFLSSGARRAEVINAGFPGTCLGEKVAWYESAVRPFQPRLVLLALAGDDVDGDLYWRVYTLQDGEAVRVPPAPQTRSAQRTRGTLARVPGAAWLAERSQLVALARRGLTRGLSRERTTALGQRPATPEEVRVFRGEGLSLLRAELRLLARSAAGNGSALAVVFVPFRQGVYGDPGWWADELRWKSQATADAAAVVLAGHGVPFLDLTGALSRRARTSPPLYHQGGETHPTPAGYRAIAEELAVWLEASGALTAR
jgi:lysophospholipase L1-like esterase